VSSAATFSVATYNLENYLDQSAGHRRPKPESARARIRESIRALKPDIIALQEIGGTNALLELRATLNSEGLAYTHWEMVSGFDTNLHVAVLSRFAFVSRHPHTDEAFLLNGRQFHVSRGFAEVNVQVNAGYEFTLIATHLKSRREVPEADEAELREQEATLLRGIIDARLTANPNVNLVVLGDFNDLKNSRPVRTILGRGKTALIDIRPIERNGDDPTMSGTDEPPRNVAWTYYFAKDDTYSRIDYILVSRGMAREWERDGTYVLALSRWGVASDHRPLVATFIAEDR
jgi:endonuclease/exonuclease/phosphatase family metal-dependent hydrolase